MFIPGAGSRRFRGPAPQLIGNSIDDSILPPVGGEDRGPFPPPHAHRTRIVRSGTPAARETGTSSPRSAWPPCPLGFEKSPTWWPHRHDHKTSIRDGVSVELWPLTSAGRRDEPTGFLRRCHARAVAGCTGSRRREKLSRNVAGVRRARLVTRESGGRTLPDASQWAAVRLESLTQTC